MINACTIFLMVNICFAQDSKSKNRLNFQVPEDWPVEKRGGLVGPIPTEEYVVIKFKATEEKFQSMKGDIEDKFNELQINLENMEVKFLKEIKETQTLKESDSLARNEDLDDVLLTLGRLESELGRLDRKITNKVAEVKAKSDTFSVQFESIEQKLDNLQKLFYRLNEEIGFISDKQDGY